MPGHFDMRAFRAFEARAVMKTFSMQIQAIQQNVYTTNVWLMWRYRSFSCSANTYRFVAFQVHVQKLYSAYQAPILLLKLTLKLCSCVCWIRLQYSSERSIITLERSRRDFGNLECYSYRLNKDNQDQLSQEKIQVLYLTAHTVKLL